MAKNKKSRRKPSAGGVATAGDAPAGTRFDEATSVQTSDPTNNGFGDGPNRSSGGGPFRLYKPGQGLYTRAGTAIASAVIAAFGAHYLYTTVSADNPAWQLGVPTAFLAVCGVIIYWVTGVSRKCNDFFIATEGEMKKVSWSTRKEVIGSTKVVLMFTLLMAFLLFFVDIIFMAFFSWIGVLDINLRDALGL